MEKTNETLITCKEILSKYPTLKPSTLDYLIRNQIVRVIQRGKSLFRIYTQDSISDIEAWLKKRGDL